MTGKPGATGDDISAEAHLTAHRRERARTVPRGSCPCGLAVQALSTPGEDMSADEIRPLASAAIT